MLDSLRLLWWDRRARRLGIPIRTGEAIAGRVSEPLHPTSESDLLSTEFYRRHLLDDLLPFWRQRENEGAFQILLRRDGTSFAGLVPSATAQARLVYAFSRGHAVCDGSGFDAVAARAVDHLIRSYWDREYGGWYRQVDADGAVVDDSKFSFDQAYVISGLAEYVRVTDDERARGYLVDTLKIVQEQVWDPVHAGYLDWLERDWSIRQSRKTLCIHVDLLAGLLAAHAVLSEQGLLEQVKTLANIMRDRMLYQKSGLFLEVFQRDFVYTPLGCDDTVVTGHTFKVAKHFLAISDLTDDASYAETAKQIVDCTLEFAWDHEHGGLFHEVFRNGAIKSEEKVWWTLCEGLITLLMLFERTGEQAYLDRYRELAAFAFEYFADPEFGEWIISTHRDGAPKCTDKGGTLEKAAFHTVEYASYAAVAFGQLGAEPQGSSS